MTKIILPTYTTKLPSTGKTVSYRPFTVREEKALLLALEENNIETVGAVLKNTIRVCTDSVIDPDDITYYDMEYLFLQIRAKSVGEVINMVGTCECEDYDTPADTKFSIDVTKCAVVGLVQNNTVKIVDSSYSVTLRHPTLSNFISAFKNESMSGIEMIASCITSVYNDEEVFDWDPKQKIEFVESMSPKQQKDVISFLDTMPTVQLDSSFTCSRCGKVHVEKLSGFENFFV